jgi:hypothetical protein
LVSTLLLIIYATNIVSASKSGINKRLKSTLLELEFPNEQLPVLTPAFGNYLDLVQGNKLLFLSSAAPQTPAGTYITGRVPNEVSVDQAVISMCMSSKSIK